MYKNKYRIESSRLKDYDYSCNGYYFITICTKNREHIFGEIVNGKMILNEFGIIAETEFLKSFDIRMELFCDCFIIMPDHLHTIIIIDSDDGDCCNKNAAETHGLASLRCNDCNQNIVGINSRASLQFDCNDRNDYKMPKRFPKSISPFVAGFKSICTKRINQKRKTPGMPIWQSRFHDHIILNDKELNVI